MSVNIGRMLFLDAFLRHSLTILAQELSLGRDASRFVEEVRSWAPQTIEYDIQFHRPLSLVVSYAWVTP